MTRLDYIKRQITKSKLSLSTIHDCQLFLCCPVWWTPPVWHSMEVKTIYLGTLFVPALTLSQWHSLAYEGNAEGSPVLFPVLCRLPTEWIRPIPGISQGMWLECYLLPSGMPGSWFCLGFHEWPGTFTVSAFSHNATGRRCLKNKNSKLSLNNESRHTCTHARTRRQHFLPQKC